MIEVFNQDKINPHELAIVREKLLERGTKWATIRPGNNCVWVNHGSFSEYFIFADGKLIDTQID